MGRLFGTDGVRGVANVELTCPLAFRLGQAAVRFQGPRILVGKDTRLSGDMLEAALIAGLVGMVIRKRFFINMEGTLMGSFAMVCVCIWNGCFNSIQVICRERDVIKREHRSGMHISSILLPRISSLRSPEPIT